MNIIVFGSTGGTGRQIIQQALDTGHSVTAVARNPATLNVQHPRLRLVKADVLQLPEFEQVVQNQDVVLSALGWRSKKDVFVYSQGVGNIVAAMEKYGVRRILCVSAAAVQTNPKLSFIFRVATKLLQRIFKSAYANILSMENLLQSSELDWTVVRPPRLTNAALKGKYRFSINEWLARCHFISRADLAHFMLHHVSDRNSFQSIVEVAY